MTRAFSWRLYYYALLGALGGFAGWLAGAVLAQNVPYFRTQDAGAVGARGAIAGACIGFACAAYYGLKASSGGLLLHNSWKGVGLGLLAGGPALIAAEKIYGGIQAAGNLELILAVFCWAVFSAAIGLAEGLNSGSELWKGVLGGVAGGILGGLFYELFGRTGADESTRQNWQAITFTVLGGCIGASISLVVSILSDATIEVMSGKLKGERLNVSKFVNPVTGSKMKGVAGSDYSSTRSGEFQFYLPGDPQIAGRHASISYRDNAPTLTILDEALERQLPSLLNGRPIKSFPLAPGDRITLGSTELVFHAKRGAKAGR